MIEAEVVEDGVRFSGSIAGDSRAFIDSDWLALSGIGPVEPLYWSPGELRYAGTTVVISPEISGPEAAAAAFRAVASESLEAVRDLPRTEVGVSGRGCIAMMASEALAARSHDQRTGQARGWLEFTGRPANIAQAAGSVENLGVVVLAGAVSNPGPLDLYRDVHARSIRLVGVGPLLSREPLPQGWAAPSPQPATLQAQCPAAAWYELRGSGPPRRS